MANPIKTSTIQYVKERNQPDKPVNFNVNEWKSKIKQDFSNATAELPVQKISRKQQGALNCQDKAKQFDEVLRSYPNLDELTHQDHSDSKPLITLSNRRSHNKYHTKCLIKYYRSLYELKKHTPLHRDYALTKLRSLLNQSNLTSITEVDQFIANNGYIFTPYNFRRKRDRAEFSTLGKLIQHSIAVKSHKYTPDEKRIFFQQYHNILYYLCELDNLESINLDDLKRSPMTQTLAKIVEDFNHYKHHDKIRKSYLLALREHLLFIANDNSRHLDLEKSALKKQIANLLGIDCKKLMQLTHKSKLEHYLNEQFRRFDIGVPDPADQTHYDTYVNQLIAVLLTTDQTLEAYDRNRAQQTRQLALQLAYTGHFTESANTSLGQLIQTLTELANTEPKLKEYLNSKTSSLKKIQGHITEKIRLNFQEASIALKEYICQGTMPSRGDPSFIQLIALLDRFVDPKERYQKQANGQYACAQGLERFLEEFQQYTVSDQSSYNNQQYQKQQEILHQFFDYVWQQLNLQQSIDITDFNPTAPSQGLQTITFVRDGKKALNEFARNFGLLDRRIKRNHSAEQLLTQINKLTSLLSKDERENVRKKLKSIIKTHDITTIRHAPARMIFNLKNPKNPADFKQVKSLMELKRIIQKKIQQLPYEDRVINNTNYLIKELKRIVLADSALKPVLDEAIIESNAIKQKLTTASALNRQTAVYYQQLAQLRKTLTAHLVARNIPLPTMNPLGDLEPAVPVYHATHDSRPTISYSKHQYRKENERIKWAKYFLSLSFAGGQVACGLLGMSILPAYMPFWIAMTIMSLGSIASLYSNFRFVKSSNQTLLRQLYILRDFWLGYRSPSGKLLIGLTYGLAIMFSATFACLVGLSFPFFTATTPWMLIALYLTKAAAVYFALVTFSNMSLFMAVAVSNLWNRGYALLTSLFPEITYRYEKSDVLGSSLGFTGLIAGLFSGITRLLKTELNQDHMKTRLKDIRYYLANPTGNPAATASDKFYRHLHNVLTAIYSAGLLVAAGYLCYLSCTSSIAAWSNFFHGALIATGISTATAAFTTLLVVRIATNFVNTSFNINAFTSGSMSLAAVCSKWTVDLLVRLPIRLIVTSVYILEEILSLNLFRDAFSTNENQDTQAGHFWKDPGQATYNLYLDIREFLSSTFRVTLDIAIILGNAFSFSSPVMLKDLENPQLTTSKALTRTAANISNSAAANAGGVQAEYQGILPRTIPQASKYIAQAVNHNVIQHVAITPTILKNIPSEEAAKEEKPEEAILAASEQPKDGPAIKAKKPKKTTPLPVEEQGQQVKEIGTQNLQKLHFLAGRVLSNPQCAERSLAFTTDSKYYTVDHSSMMISV